MPLFVMIGHDGPEGQARRDQNRAAHLAHWDRLDSEGRIALAGPIRDRDDTHSVGAVIVFEAADLEEARKLVASDPYVAGGVFGSYSVSPFKKAYPQKP